jgi:hypothetical protein
VTIFRVTGSKKVFIAAPATLVTAIAAPIPIAAANAERLKSIAPSNLKVIRCAVLAERPAGNNMAGTGFPAGVA